jgi:hypothetical protein
MILALLQHLAMVASDDGLFAVIVTYVWVVSYQVAMVAKNHTFPPATHQIP